MIKTCARGHRFEKTSACPVCPLCEKARPGTGSFLDQLGAPARRALERAGITTPQKLAQYSEREILSLHGMGPASLPALRQALKAAKLAFKEPLPHALPADMKKSLAPPKIKAAWDSLTPLARNEWICWVISVKTPEIRQEHIQRLCVDLQKGKRRPCCWIGCTHRKDKPLSPSQKFILKR